jgi:hypothetical protein
MMELVPMVALAPVLMVTQVLARMAFQVPKEAEASLLLSPELTVLVIRQELVELAELQVSDVLAPVVMVELVLQAARVDLTSVYRALFLADLRVNRLQMVHKHVLLALEEVPMEVHLGQVELAA